MGLQEIQNYRRDLAAFLSKTPSHEEFSSIALEKESKQAKTRTFNISKNATREYSLDEETLSLMDYTHQVFFDGEEKVFEIFCIDREISIQVFGENQVNLFSNIKARSLDIESQAAVYFGSTVTADSLNIKAKALCFHDSVKCREAVIETQEALVLQNTCKAQKLKCLAGMVIQEQACHLGSANISCKKYFQNENASFHAKNLIIATEYFQSLGDVKVSESAFIASHGLLIGGKEHPVHWELSSLHHLHFTNVNISDFAHLKINPVPKHNGKFVVDENLHVAKTAHLELIQTLFHVGFLESEGQFDLQLASLKAKKFNQFGQFNALKAEVFLDEFFFQDDEGKTEVKNSIMQTEELVVVSGEFKGLQDSQLKIESQFTSDESSIVYLERCKVVANHAMFISGQMIADYTQISTGQFKSFQNIKTNKVIISAPFIYIFEQSSITDSELKSKHLEIYDDGHLAQSDLTGQVIILTIQDTVLNNCTIEAEKLMVSPSGSGVSFHHECYLVAKLFFFDKAIHIQDSTLVAIDDEGSKHVFVGETVLDKSFFFSHSQLVHTQPLKAINGSAIFADEIDSLGTLMPEQAMLEVKRIKQYSPLISHQSSIVIEESIVSNQQILLNEYSRLVTKKVLLETLGCLKLQKNSQVFSEESIVLEPGSQLQANESLVSTKKMCVEGQVTLLKSLLDVEELDVYEQFEAKQNSALKVHGQMRTAEESLLDFEYSSLQAKKFMSFGYTFLTDSSIHVEQYLDLGQTSRTLLDGQSGLSAENIFSMGKMVVDQSASKHEKAMPYLHAKNRLSVMDEASIYGDSLVMQANTLSNYGQVFMEKNLIAKGQWFSNSGDIDASEAMLGFDYLTFNMGSIAADKLTINSNIFNFLGGIYARKSLSTSGILNLNFGLVGANNYYNNSLISINGGLIAPNLAADITDIISIQNVIGLVANNINMIAPGYAQGIGLITTAMTVFNTAKSIYHDYSTLTWDKLSSMELHEWYPLLGKAKNYFSVGQSIYSNISGLSAEAANWKHALHNLKHHPNKIFDVAKKSLQEANWKQMGMSTAGYLFGTYSDNSFVHVNAGISFMPNTTQWNFVDCNYGIERSIFNHSKMTSYFVNEGYSGGGQATFMFDEMKNTGELEGQFKLVMKGRQAQNLGTIKGINAMLDVQELQQQGTLDLKKAFVKVEKFEDSEGATTRLEEASVQGKTLDQHGTFQFTKVSVKESEHYHADAAAKSEFDSVYIETKDFSYDGSLDYQHQCTVVADHIVLGEHSKVNGAKTEKEKLFKDKPPAPPKNDENKDGGEKPKDSNDPAKEGGEKPKEPEKEFCPQHILSLHGKKTELKGGLTGGDYTQISGNPHAKPGDPDFSADDVFVAETAHIDLDYGSISAKNMQTLGFAHFDHFNFKVGHHEISQQAHFGFTNGYYEGDYLSNSAFFTASNSYFKVTSVLFNQGATENFYETFFESKQIIDKSHLYTSGQVVFSTEDYQHRGDIHNDKPAEPGKRNLFYVKSKTAQLDGRCELDNVFFDIESFKEAKELAGGSGKYSLYFASESFGLSTKGNLELNQELLRNCHMYLQADAISMTQGYNKQYDLTLVSNLGDVKLLADVHANNFYVQSAGKIITNTRLEATNTLAFEAKGAIENYGGFINAKTTSLVGSEIKNITAGSNAAKNGTPIAVGGAGIINASERLYLTATQGNIENHGGLMRAGIYAQLLAKGNVLNLCNTRTYQGQFDVIKEFDPGVIQGGTGEGEAKIGLYIKADGQVIGDASDFISNGTNYIQGVQGIHLGCQSHTYVSNYQNERGFMGFTHKVVIDTHTNLKGCDVRSTNGRNILISDEGGITTQAANFISPGGTDIYAKKDVRLQSAVYSDRHYVYKGKFWDVFKDVHDDVVGQSAPTFFYDNGSTRIKSAEGCVDARGAYFLGGGDLSIEAHGKIYIGRDKLDQQRDSYSRSVNWSIPGLAGATALMNGAGVWGAMTAEDATLAKLNSLLGSQSAAELLANASNLGVDLTNTTNSACRAIGSGHISEELLSRYGLGGAKGFNPSASVGVSQTQSSLHTQTLGKGGIERGGNVSLKSDTGIEVFNGAPIHAGKNLDLDAPSFIAHAAELDTHAKKHTEGLSFHLNLSNGVQSTHASASQSEQHSTQYVYSDIRSGGTTTVHCGDGAMGHLELDGATINAKNIEGSVDHLVITDKQDSQQSSSKSVSVGSNGAFSVSASKSSEQVTNHHSGIHTSDDLNTAEHHFEVKHTTMTGGSITSDGVNHFETETLESHELHDSKHQIGVGYSGHLPDFDAPHHAPHNRPGEKVVDTPAHVKLDFVHYEATQASVLYGAGGNDFHVQEYVGDEVHTSSADGKTVESDVNEHIKLDVPVVHAENLEMLSTNVRRFFDKVAPVAEKTAEVLGLPPRRPHEPQSHGTSVSAGPHPHSPKGAITQALKNVHLDPKLAARVEQELKHGGHLSASTQNLLKQQIGEALLKSLKAGTEHGWDKLTEKALKDVLSRSDQWVSKIHLGSIGAIIQFEFNLFLSDAPDSSGKMKHAIAQTGTDIVVGMVLSQIPGVGWALTIADIMDSFYDEAHIQELLELNGQMNQAAIKAMQEGNYFQGIALADQSKGLLAAAGAMELMHQLANATAPIVKKFEDMMGEHEEEQQRHAAGF